MTPLVELTPIREDHADLVIRWRSDPVIARELFSQDAPTREAHVAWVRALGDRRREFVIVARPEGVEVGTIGIGQIDRHHRNGEYGILIGEAAYRGRGYARAASEQVLRYAFDELGLHRVTLRVFADNEPALRLYTKLGFRREGLLREHAVVPGGYRDVVVMGILEDEWRRRA